MINSYEKDLNSLFKEYVYGCIDCIRSSKDSPADIVKKIERLQNKMKPKFESLAEDQVIRAWEQGQTYAALNLKRGSRGRKKEKD